MGRQVVRYVDSELKFDSRLVNIVKEHKHLFDKSHKLFEDPSTRLDTWEYIATNLGQSESYCEKRWQYIINRFYDEILWMIRYDATTSLWLLYPQLDFLATFIDWEDINTLQEIMEFDTAIALEGA